MIRHDTHLHTDYSPDSHTPVVDQIRQAHRLGLYGIGITDHMDHGFPEDQLPPGWVGTAFNFDVEEYIFGLEKLRESEQDMDICIGVECGLLTDTEVVEFNRKLCVDPRFDYAIGSIHLIDKKDPYYPPFWEGRRFQNVMRRYFEITLENIELFQSFQILGHMDYAVRYAPEKGMYIPADYFEITDEIMRFLIRNDIALEVNTSSLRKGFGFTNPHPDFIQRYHELGGQLITIGSDSHDTDGMAFAFDEAETMLREIGFHEYAVFHGKKPVMQPL